MAAKKFNYTFKSGSTATATLNDIEKMCSAMGEKVDYKQIGVTPKGYYPSETKGLVKISTMNDYHIRQALLKRAKEYYASLYRATDTNATFLVKFTQLTDDQIVLDLYSELSARVK